jgi:universal stress protein A
VRRALREDAAIGIGSCRCGRSTRAGDDERPQGVRGERVARPRFMDAPNPATNTILVPVDFDDTSRRAVEHAGSLARALGARVLILHVVPPTSFPEGTLLLPLEPGDPVDLGQYVPDDALRLLRESFVKCLQAGVEVREEARSGHPLETILRAIREWDATLVVLGTHGRTGVDRLLHGSVAEEVMRRTDVPVLVVPAAA